MNFSTQYKPPKTLRSSQDVVFIDTGNCDLDHYFDRMSLELGLSMMVIPPNLDGVLHITKILSTTDVVRKVHIVSHGAPGSMGLGNAELSLDTMDYYAWDLQSWFPPNAHLTQSALILHSNNVATGAQGVQFLEQLRLLCGVPIAISSLPTSDRETRCTPADSTVDEGKNIIPFRPRTR